MKTSRTLALGALSAFMAASGCSVAGPRSSVDTDGHVTLGGLENFVREHVKETARRSNRDQTPRLLGDSNLRLY